MNKMEQERGTNTVTHALPDRSAVQLVTTAGRGRGHEMVKKFRFGMCVGQTTTQAEFFALSGIQSLIDSAING